MNKFLAEYLDKEWKTFNCLKLHRIKSVSVVLTCHLLSTGKLHIIKWRLN